MSATLTDEDVIRFMVRRKHAACRPLGREQCEGGCGRASHYDSEDVPLCCYCVEMLVLEERQRAAEKRTS